MKVFIFIVSVCLISVTGLYGQFSVGLKAGTSPQVNPQTHYVIVDRSNVAHTMLFNVEQVKYGEQIGLALRYDKRPWWFMTELMYASSAVMYSMAPATTDPGTPPLLAEEKCKFLDIPVSAGVRLGVIEIFSGFTATRNLSYRTELEQVEGFAQKMPSWTLGWHTGVGVSVQHVTFDLRYQQAFVNYGQNRFMHGEELMLHNSPGRLVAMVGFRI